MKVTGSRMLINLHYTDVLMQNQSLSIFKSVYFMMIIIDALINFDLPLSQNGIEANFQDIHNQ